MDIMETISECVLTGDYQKIKKEVQSALDQGHLPQDVIDSGLLKGMGIVGEKFRNDELFVPEVMVAARAMHAGLDILKPHLTQAAKSCGTIVIGTVKGDMHDIGKNIVSLMFEGSGFKVIDLGVDVHPQKFVDEVRNSKAQIVGLSALLTTTIPAMEKTIDLLKESGLKGHVKIMVGGAPVSESTAQKVGADAYGKNAAEAVMKAKQLLGIP